jgi:hypothetical protein
VNALIDHTIKKIITHDHYTVHYLLITAEVTNVQHLKRTGDCVKTAAVIKSNFNLIQLTLKKLTFSMKKFLFKALYFRMSCG